MPMSVVTIYLCGTGKHRDLPEYLIGHLHDLDAAEASAGDRNGRKLVLDGPGAGSGHAIKAIKDAVEGTADPANLPNRSNFSGTTSGLGWADNTHFAMQWLLAVDAESRRGGHPITVVNMVGHSRGAVTATMIAHLMHRERPAWRANIFAVDPVPGSDATSFTANTGMPGNPFVMPANVGAYSTILMEHVPSTGKDVFFQPVHLKQLRFEGDTIVRMWPLPGKHGDAVKQDFTEYPVSFISAHLISSWLRHYGTPIDAQYIRTNEALVEQYAEVFLKRLAAKKKKAASGIGDGSRANPCRWALGTQWINDRARVIDNPTREHPYYLNLHHASLFQLAFGDATRRLDEQQWVRSFEVAPLERRFPKSVELLRKLRLVADDDLADRLEDMIRRYQSRTTGVKGFFSRQSDTSTAAIAALGELLREFRYAPFNLERPVIFLLHGRYAGSIPVAGVTQLNNGSRLHGMLTETYGGWRRDWRVRVLG